MSRINFFLLTAAFIIAGCSDGSSGGDDGGATDTGTDTGPIECNLDTYNGNLIINTQSDVATLAGYTSIFGNLSIYCPSCTDLSELICLTSVGEDLWIEGNTALADLYGLSALISAGRLEIYDNSGLTNMDGLGALTSVDEYLGIGHNDALTSLYGLSALNSVGEDLSIWENDTLPDCEACDLLDQLTTTPTDIDVYNNLDDSCTPVPANCP